MRCQNNRFQQLPFLVLGVKLDNPVIFEWPGASNDFERVISDPDSIVGRKLGLPLFCFNRKHHREP